MYKCSQRFALALSTRNDLYCHVCGWAYLLSCLCSCFEAALTRSCTHVGVCSAHNKVSLHADFICLRLVTLACCSFLWLISSVVVV